MEIFGFSIWSILGLIAFLVIAPFVGCILAGLDRKITAGNAVSDRKSVV